MDLNPNQSRTKPRSISLAFFNANGLRTQKDEVFNFLRDNQIDILLVQETFLKPGYRDPKMAGYKIIRNDRTHSAKGGTVIYYRNNLHCVPLDPPLLSDMEVSVCQLAMTGHQPIIIASVYVSDSKSILSADLLALFGLGSAVILAGDFNSKHLRWNSTTSNSRGRILDVLTDTLDFDVVAPMTPTHFPFTLGHTPDILDIALLKNINLRLCSIEVIHELQSDHRPVLLKLGPPTDTPPRRKTIVDWNKLEESLKSTRSEQLDEIPDNITTIEDVNVAIDALTRHTRAVVADCTRQVPATDDRRWNLPPEVRELLRAKNAATRAYDNYPSEPNRTRLRALQRDVKRTIAEFRQTRWDSLMGEISPSHQSYWRMARALKSDTVTDMPPLVRVNQPPAFHDEDKAECLADSLESQCSPSTLPVDTEHLNAINREVERRTSLPPVESLAVTTSDEVQSLVDNLHKRKAPGADEISNRVLKLFPPQLICLLVSIFNAAMANSIFPQAWKEAIVIGIRKPNKHGSEPSSYRPISLLKGMGKIYERVLLSRLKNFMDVHNILIDEQFGFRAKHSCVQQVHRISEHILHNLVSYQRSTGTGALFFDVAKAFDKVWHNGLVYKLYQLGMPDRLVHIIQDYLQGRTFRYRVEGTLSQPRLVRAGVPQGSVLGPFLYSLYTNDIPRSPGVELALFADDTALYTTSRDRSRVGRLLQSAANALGDWFRKWRIEVNPEKSVAIYFTRSSRHRGDLRQITLFDRPIPWERSVKYLGVTLDVGLTFKSHIVRVRNRAAHVLGRLSCLVNGRSKLSLRNKLTLYKTCIRPILTFASPVFAHAAPSHIHRLQTLQNRFIRRATGAPWFLRNEDLHIDLQLPTIAQFMKLASRQFFDKADEHPNPCVVRAASYRPRANVNARKRRPRHVLDDPDDAITLAMQRQAPEGNPRNNRPTYRPRRRGRRTPTTGAYTRYRDVTGRFSPSRQVVSSNAPSRGPCPMGAVRSRPM